MCGRMFLEDSDQVEKYVGGLPDMIQARAYTAGSGEKKEYGGSLPLCTKCNYHHNGACAPKFNNCKKELAIWPVTVEVQLLLTTREPPGRLMCRLVVVWKSVRYSVSKGLDTAYWGFLGVGTTYDIFQNIHILYLRYGVLTSSGYGVLSFIPLWSLGRLRCKGDTKQIIGVVPKGLALRVVLVDLHSKDESGKGFKLE
ncbi:hypothetical protein Tco_1260412, partial [Tanacetum coccineum]